MVFLCFDVGLTGLIMVWVIKLFITVIWLRRPLCLGLKEFKAKKEHKPANQLNHMRSSLVHKLGTLTTTLRNRGRLGQGFRFRRGNRSLNSAASQTDDDFFFAKNLVLLQSRYGIPRPP